MKVYRILPAIFIVLAYLAVSPASYAAPKTQAIRFPSGITINAEVADTPASRRRGLMFRDHLPEGGGMLFVFEEDRPYRFWMKNCKFPIDIIWLDAQKAVVYFSENTPPCFSDPCPTYGPKESPARYVIEVAAGFVHERGLKVGTAIHFE